MIIYYGKSLIIGAVKRIGLFLYLVIWRGRKRWMVMVVKFGSTNRMLTYSGKIIS